MRGKLEISIGILTFCSEPRLKTQVRYEVGLSFFQFQTYEEWLLSQGLLLKEANRYLTTEKGQRVVRIYILLQNTLVSRI